MFWFGLIVGIALATLVCAIAALTFFLWIAGDPSMPGHDPLDHS